MQSHRVSAQFMIMKRNEEQRIAFGWAYQCKDAAGNQMVDHSGDMIEPETLEKAAYRFVELYREGSDNHERGGVGVMVESMMFTPEKTKALGIPDGVLPTGWWVGFRVLDDDVWQKVKDGTYSMFSVEGRCNSSALSNNPYIKHYRYPHQNIGYARYKHYTKTIQMEARSQGT